MDHWLINFKTMKRFLYLIVLLSVMMSCKKTSYVAVFDKTPQERAADQINLVSTTLTSAPNGWIATLPTQAGGGYGFYFTFDNQQNVTMYADMTSASAGTVGKSNYRIKQDIGTELVFDTYNYISILDDPNAAILGGASKVGYSSDIEFTFDRVNGDSIIFVGKKYRQPFKLVKATAAQQASYTSGGYNTSIDKITAFFNTNKFPYIQVVSGSTTLKVAVSPNFSNNLASGKRMDLTSVLADGKTIGTAATKIAHTLDGLSLLNGGLVFQGITFVRMAWKDANILALYDSTGKEYIINDNGVPILDINLLWGSKYVGLRSEFKQVNPGTSTAGADIINYYHNNLNNSALLGFGFNYGRMDLTWSRPNNRFIFAGFSSQNGGSSGWTTTIVYNYTVNPDGSYKFTQYTAAADGYVAKLMLPMDAFLKANDVKFDYYSINGLTYGRMSSVQNPAIQMTFILR
ncbi:hypothetical protein ASE74_12965 [Pedobacter sp. Leaf216]|nr:hypothetical protein ASE74_12965 [Pedobacter sp. Leaf216]